MAVEAATSSLVESHTKQLIVLTGYILDIKKSQAFIQTEVSLTGQVVQAISSDLVLTTLTKLICYERMKPAKFSLSTLSSHTDIIQADACKEYVHIVCNSEDIEVCLPTWRSKRAIPDALASG